MRKGRSSLVLISGTVLIGVLDCRSVVNRTTSRSQYGIKKIINERTSCDVVVISKNIFKIVTSLILPMPLKSDNMYCLKLVLLIVSYRTCIGFTGGCNVDST